MTETMVLTESEALELFAFLLSSARTQVDEPCRYASMRVLTAAEILRDFMLARASADTQIMLQKTLAPASHAHVYMADTETYVATLDDLCRMVAEHAVARSGLGEEKS